MGTNDDRLRGGGNPFGGLMATVVATVPFAAGAYGAYTAVAKSGQPITSPLNNRITEASRAAGSKLRGQLSNRTAAMAERGREMAQALMQHDGLTKFWQDINERNAVIASLQNTIDDPTLGIDDNKLKGLRDALSRLAAQDIKEDVTPQIKEMLTSAIQGVASSPNPQTRAAFAASLTTNRKLGSNLQPGTMSFQSGVVVNPINEGHLSTGARNRLKEWKGLMGHGVSYDLEEVGGVAYARTTRAGGHHLMNFPLELAGNSQGIATFRMGQGYQTAYNVGNTYITGSHLLALQGKTPKPTLAQVRSAGTDFSGTILETTRRELARAGGVQHISAHHLNEQIREYAQVQHRGLDALAATHDPSAQFMAHHLRSGTAISQNNLVVTHIDERMKDKFPKALLGIGGTDPGVSNDSLIHRSPLTKDYSAAVAVRDTGSLSAYGPARMAVADLEERLGLPVTARELQMTGRTVAFVPVAHANKRSLGMSYMQHGENIAWANHVTGGTNRMAVLDWSKRNHFGTEGYGQVYATGGFETAEHITKPILHPGNMNVMSSKLANDIASRPGEITWLTPQQIRARGNFLGMGADGPQMINTSNHTRRVGLMASEMASDGTKAGKDMIHFSGVKISRYESNMKIFSDMFKATTSRITRGQAAEASGGLTRHVAKTYGVNAGAFVLGQAEMGRKGAAYMWSAVAGTLGTMRKFDNPVAALHARAAEFAAGRHNGPVSRILSGGVHSEMSARAAATMSLLHERGGTAQEMAYAMTPFWHAGTAFSDRHVGSVNRQQITRAMQHLYGGNKAELKDAFKIMHKGLSFSATTVFAGDPPDSWGRSMGSIEPRTLQILQERLRGYGMSVDEISHTVANLLGRKAGIREHLNIANQLEQTVKSMSGQRTIAEHMGDARRVGMAEIQDLVTLHGQTGAAAAMLKDGHVVLDLADMGAQVGGPGITAATKAVMHGSTDIYLPGGELLHDMRGALIKGSGGSSTQIDADYLRHTDHFLNSLVGGASNAGSADIMKTKLEDYKKNIGNLWGGSWDNIVRGKIRGSQYMRGAAINLSMPIGYTADQAAWVRGVYHRSGGSSVFMEGESFMTQLQGFMGTTRKIGMDGKAKIASTGRKFRMKGARRMNAAGDTLDTDLAAAARDFFLSPHMEAGRARGVAQLGGRDPQLSLGHMFGAQVFREKRNADRDTIFKKFTSTRRGQEALKSLRRSTGNDALSSFHDIAGLDKRHAGATNKFFGRMTGKMDDWVHWSGGGTIHIPQADMKVHYGGGITHQINTSISAAAIGDFDGDYYKMFMLDTKSGKRIISTLGTSHGTAAMQRDMQYRVSSHTFMEEAKNTMKRENKMSGTQLDAFMLEQDVLKEAAVKTATPMLDVNLNTLRIALLAHGDVEKNVHGLAFLKVAEEFASLKSKKLAIWKDLPSQLSGAVEHMHRTGESDRFRSVVKDIFHGSGLRDAAGMTVQGIEAVGLNHIPHSNSVTGMNLQLDNIVDHIATAANSARIDGMHRVSTMGRAISGMTSKERNTAVNTLAALGETFQGGVLEGLVGDAVKTSERIATNTMKRVFTASDLLSAKAMGPLALGAVGSVLVQAALGSNNYSPTPLLAPGETVSAEVSHGIAYNMVFGQKQHGPSPEQLQQSAGTDGFMPASPGTTYFQQQNAYQLYGETTDAGASGEIANYMAQLTRGLGSSSVTINDRRRPITQNYMDRIAGE